MAVDWSWTSCRTNLLHLPWVRETQQDRAGLRGTVMEPPPGSRRAAGPADDRWLCGKQLRSQQSHRGPRKCPLPSDGPLLLQCPFMSLRLYLNSIISFLERPGEAAIQVTHTPACFVQWGVEQRGLHLGVSCYFIIGVFSHWWTSAHFLRGVSLLPVSYHRRSHRRNPTDLHVGLMAGSVFILLELAW